MSAVFGVVCFLLCLLSLSHMLIWLQCYNGSVLSGIISAMFCSYTSVAATTVGVFNTRIRDGGLFL